MTPPFVRLELTHRCNHRCRHCYLTRYCGDLDAGRLAEILAHLAPGRCRLITLTGGEPTLRDDFAALYEQAAAVAPVYLMTNGTQLADRPEIVAVLRRRPPAAVQVPLYAATPAVHDAITGTPGSFGRALAGLEALADAGLPTVVEMLVFRHTRNDVATVRDLAGERGARFRLATIIHPRRDGNTDNREGALEPAEAVDLAARYPEAIGPCSLAAGAATPPAALCVHIGPDGRPIGGRDAER